MSIRDTLREVRNLITDQDASDWIRDTHAKKQQVLRSLQNHGFGEVSFEYATVKHWDHDTADYLINSMLTHFPKHQALSIIEACTQIFPALPIDAPALTDEQLDISARFLTKYPPLCISTGSATIHPTHAYRETVLYAMTHTEDWHLIEPLIFDRGILMLTTILAVTSTMKADSPNVLAEGTL